MIKFKDLIKILPNPKEFYLCIMDEYEEYTHPKDLVYSRCTTYDFKSFSFRDQEESKHYTKDRINELLEYEVVGIDNYTWTGQLYNGEKWGVNLDTGKAYPENDHDYDKISHYFYIYIDKPVKAKRKQKEIQKQTDLFSEVTENDPS